VAIDPLRFGGYAANRSGREPVVLPTNRGGGMKRMPNVLRSDPASVIGKLDFGKDRFVTLPRRVCW
jgi:hypothetical protein